MDCSMPGLPVHHQLPEFIQTHVHWVSDAIQPSVIPFSSHLQSFPALGSFQMSQFFRSGGQSTGVSASVSVLPMNIQDWSLGWAGWISLQSRGLSRVFSNTTVQKHQFFSAQLSLWSNWHIHDFPSGSDGKVSVYNAGDPGSIPGLGRSPGEGNGNPLQDYCLENPMDRGAW